MYKIKKKKKLSLRKSPAAARPFFRTRLFFFWHFSNSHQHQHTHTVQATLLLQSEPRESSSFIVVKQQQWPRSRFFRLVIFSRSEVTSRWFESRAQSVLLPGWNRRRRRRRCHRAFRDRVAEESKRYGDTTSSSPYLESADGWQKKDGRRPKLKRISSSSPTWWKIGLTVCVEVVSFCVFAWRDCQTEQILWEARLPVREQLVQPTVMGRK